jgi:hypothetical protein
MAAGLPSDVCILLSFSFQDFKLQSLKLAPLKVNAALNSDIHDRYLI